MARPKPVPIAVYTRLGGDLSRTGSTGLPGLCCEAVVIDDAGAELPPDTPGEIAVRGPNVFVEYWGNAAATREVLREGWFRTGDIGRRDADGYFFVHDRKKNMIISGGENIYPAEVERVLLEHPDVADCGVIGRPDAKWDEVPVAYVIPRAGCRVDAEALKAHVLTQLARFKVPREFVFVEDLPRTALGKVQHFRLKADRGRKRVKIAVLGGGNGSFAAAGDFALQGHDVRLWRRDAAAVAAHRAAGSRIVVKDSKGRHDAQLALVTTDIAEAVRDAELILCPAPAFAQHDIAAQLAPHLARWAGGVPAAGDVRLRHFCESRARRRQSCRRRVRRDRHAAMADAQAWSVRSRHHHPRQTAAGRRVSAERLPIMRSMSFRARFPA